MNAVAQILSGLMALVLIVMWVLEAFFHKARALYPILRIDAEDVPAVRMWAINVGFYNLCYGVGILVGLWLVSVGWVEAGRGIVCFCLASHVLLGAVLVGSEPKLWRSGLGESLLALAGLIALLAGRDAVPGVGGSVRAANHRLAGPERISWPHVRSRAAAARERSHRFPKAAR
jgi:putative membrane protein